MDARTTCRTLTDCLSQLRGWSDAHPMHQPLFILLEPKDEFDEDLVLGYFQDLEAELRAAWPEDRIITPGAVLGEYPSLSVAITQRGWPTLSASRGKVAFALLDKSNQCQLSASQVAGARAHTEQVFDSKKPVSGDPREKNTPGGY